MSALEFWLGWGLQLLIIFGALVFAYSKTVASESGKIDAISLNLATVVDNIEAQTRATEVIKASISNDVWDRQRRWELKKEVSFKVVSDLTFLHDALSGLHARMQTQRQSPESGAQHHLDSIWGALQTWNSVSTSLNTSIIHAQIVCGVQFQNALQVANIEVRGVFIRVNNGELDFYPNSLEQIVLAMRNLQNATRQELGIPEVA
jgi:hypothetical protein